MDLWYKETHEGNGITFKVKNVIYKETSRYQEVVILDTEFHGKVMLLDGLVMLTERDEFVYHEMIVHPALTTHKNPENVLVIGGGDGGTVREILKYDSVKRIDLVEIDELVIESSRKYLPFVSSGYSDKRVNIFVEDGIKFVSSKENYYDVVIIDSTDPIGPAIGLFREDFYRKIEKSLRGDGIMIAQSESPFVNSDIIKSMYKDIGRVFENLSMYLAFIPTYPSGMWSFAFASNGYSMMEFDKERSSKISSLCKYYNPDVHLSSMALPNFVKELL